MRLTIGIPCAVFSDNLCMISVDGKMNDNNERGDSTQKIEKSWRARVPYIGSERLYVGRLRNITLPFGLGIHDDANQSSGGHTLSFSIFTS